MFCTNWALVKARSRLCISIRVTDKTKARESGNDASLVLPETIYNLLHGFHSASI